MCNKSLSGLSIFDPPEGLLKRSFALNNQSPQ